MNILKLLMVAVGLALGTSQLLAQTAERPTWDIKDRWEYQFTKKNDGNKVSEYSHEIEKLEDAKITVRRQNKNAEGAFTSGGRVIYSADMNYVSASATESVVTPDSRTLQWPLEVGKKYAVEYEWTNASNAQKGNFEYKATVESYEDITVPAGTFKAYKIAFKGFWNRRDSQYSGSGRSNHILWYAPDVKRWVRWTIEDRTSNGQLYNDNVAELVKYTPAK